MGRRERASLAVLPAPPAVPSHAPEDLALVQPRGFGDALPEPPRPALRRRHDQLPRIPRPVRGARGLPAEGMRRAARRPRRAVHAQQPAVRDRLLRHPARRRRGRAHQLHEHRRASSSTSCATRAPRRSSRRRSCSRASSPCSATPFSTPSSPATRTTLATSRGVACCPRRWPRRACTFRRSRRSRSGTKRSTQAHAPGAARGRARRSRVDLLHLRHHGQAQGLHAPAPRRHAQRRGHRALARRAPARAARSPCCRCSTSPACRTR